MPSAAKLAVCKHLNTVKAHDGHDTKTYTQACMHGQPECSKVLPKTVAWTQPLDMRLHVLHDAGKVLQAADTQLCLITWF